MELNFMLCNYDKCPNEENNQCPECMSGMMVLIGIIGGIVAAAVGVLLFVNEILTAPFTAALAALIISSVFLFTVIIASAAYYGYIKIFKQLGLDEYFVEQSDSDL